MTFQRQVVQRYTASQQVLAETIDDLVAELDLDDGDEAALELVDGNVAGVAHAAPTPSLALSSRT